MNTAGDKKRMPFAQCFALLTWGRARLFAEGMLCLHEAADFLASYAAAHGVDTDEAQRVMSAEFGAVR